MKNKRTKAERKEALRSVGVWQSAGAGMLRHFQSRSRSWGGGPCRARPAREHIRENAD